jgi:hypothetical protein
VLATVAVVLVATQLVLEGAAQFAERRLGAFLWRQQDFFRLFNPQNYVGQGRGRLLIYGPSEAREGLFPEAIAPGVPGLVPYQHSQSIGTLEDGLIVLSYIERAYGASAIPDAILLGITTRFIGDLRTQASPLQEGINRYSPHFTVMEGGHPPELVPRSAFGALRARVALLRLQPDRYRRGLYAIGRHVAIRLEPSLEARLDRGPISASKYLVGRRGTEAGWRRWLATPGNHWDLVHNWDPERHRERVIRGLGLLRDYTRRHGIELYVVNLPEISWNRELYKPGRYEAYLEIVQTALGDTPFLDLRTFLADKDFFDEAHPSWPAGFRVSERVAAFINEHRNGALTLRSRP